MCTVTRRFPTSYDLKCCQDVKLQEPTNQPAVLEVVRVVGWTVGNTRPFPGTPPVCLHIFWAIMGESVVWLRHTGEESGRRCQWRRLRFAVQVERWLVGCENPCSERGRAVLHSPLSTFHSPRTVLRRTTRCTWIVLGEWWVGRRLEILFGYDSGRVCSWLMVDKVFTNATVQVKSNPI